MILFALAPLPRSSIYKVVARLAFKKNQKKRRNSLQAVLLNNKFSATEKIITTSTFIASTSVTVVLVAG
jgi:hypothetical protein